MRRRSWVLKAISGSLWACAWLAEPCASSAQETAGGPDPVTKLALMGAVFAATPPAPNPTGVTAMAFLPGRGVVSWDVTGKTPEQAQEAQIEAMGAADARAVQRQIDAGRAEQGAQSLAPVRDKKGLWAGWSTSMPGLTAGALTELHRAGIAAPVSYVARMQSALGARNGVDMRQRPRVYAFAAVSGQGAGFNLTHDDAGWKTDGLTTDRGGFVGQRQAGLALRINGAQTSLSYLQQKTDTQILGMQKIKDHRIMVTMNLQPKAIVRALIAKR